MFKAALSLLVLSALLFFGKPAFAQTYTNTFVKDGKTYIQTKTVTEDKITIEIKVYDASGQLIDQKIVEKTPKPLPEKEITQAPVKSVVPVPTKEPILTASPSKLPSPTSKPDNPISIDPYIQTKLPLSINEETGNFMVTSDDQETELKTSPDEILAKARMQGLDMIGEVEITQKQQVLKYVVNGVKYKKLFALINISLPTVLVYDAATGTLEEVSQSSMVKLGDLLSL